MSPGELCGTRGRVELYSPAGLCQTRPGVGELQTSDEINVLLYLTCGPLCSTRDPCYNKGMAQSTWDPDEALASLAAETQLFLEEDTTDAARRIFREHTAVAAMSLVHLALHSSNERVRMDAAKTVLDRSLGPITATIPAGKDPFEELLDACVVNDRDQKGDM